jgi:hypothetical protein
MEIQTVRKKYEGAVVEVLFENQEAHDADRGAVINVTVPFADGKYAYTGIPVGAEDNKRFVRQLRFLEALDASDGKPETILRLREEFRRN